MLTLLRWRYAAAHDYCHCYDMREELRAAAFSYAIAFVDAAAYAAYAAAMMLIRCHTLTNNRIHHT